MTEGDSTLRTVADTLVGLDYRSWDFGDSVAFEAMIAASVRLGDERWSRFAHGFARAWASRASPYRRLDCTAPGQAIVRLATTYEDEHLFEAAARLADYLMDRPRIGCVFATWEHSPLMRPYGPGRLPAPEAALLADPPAGVFVDCLHFDPPFLTALGVATGNRRYWSAGLEQAVGYIRALQTPTGLFDHFVLSGHHGRYGPGWGRGQGWALLGLLHVLDNLRDLGQLTPEPGDEAMLTEVSAATAHLATAMIDLQQGDGHWAAVVTDRSSGPEHSTAAFMAAGLGMAATLDGVDTGAALEAARRARAATSFALQPDGTLSSVSAAVMACTQASHYAHVPRGFRVPWGQGPAVLALCASAGDRA